jgi:putative membrane protein
MQRLLLACTAAGLLLSANAGFAASDRQNLIPPSVPSFQSGQASPPSTAGQASPRVPAAQPAPATTAAGQSGPTTTAAGQPAPAATAPGQSAPATAPAPQQPAQPTQLSRADQAFVAAATQNSMVQLQNAQLAAQRAASPQVRQLSQRLVTDQTAASDALQQIAQQDNLTPPAQPSPMQAAQGRRLTRLYGASFDSAFLHAEALQDAQTIGLYQREAESSRDPTLKDFAQQTLSALRQHLALARSLNTVNAANATGWNGED